MKVYNALYAAFGPQHWWPAKTPFEVVVGAILTQQAPWKNVERAINNLKTAKLLTPGRIANANLLLLQKLIRPAGFYKVKSKRLKEISKLYPGMKELGKKPVNKAREDILEMDGIGPETGDSILLYAFGMPTFVVDAYTKRFVKRYGFTAGWKKVDYDNTKTFFEDNVTRNVQIYNEFHALIVELGKRHCKTKPVCERCPLSRRCKKLID
jgi:endonuclease-3 related protein